MQTGGVRVFYGVSTVSRRCFGEGVAITRTVTVRCMYGSIWCMYEHCVWTRTCLRTPVEFYNHCTWPIRVPVMAVSAHTSSWPVWLPMCLLRGKKYVHAQLSDTGCKPVELRAGPYDHPWVTGILALTVPVNYPGAPCDLGMSGECAERWS